jgi:glycosyltransferase involved in cell wall biosynthesis
MENPSVSFVIHAYNADLFIQDCFDSILNQTFQKWECIIVRYVASFAKSLILKK